MIPGEKGEMPLPHEGEFIPPCIPARPGKVPEWPEVCLTVGRYQPQISPLSQDPLRFLNVFPGVGDMLEEILLDNEIKMLAGITGLLQCDWIMKSKCSPG